MNEPDFRTLFESAPGQYLALLPDTPRFSVVAASDAYLRATLTRRDEIVGRGLFEFVAGLPQGPDDAGVRELRASLERVLEGRCSDTLALNARQGADAARRGSNVVNTPAIDALGRITYIIHRVEDGARRVPPPPQGDAQATSATALRERVQKMEVEVVARAREVDAANEQLRSAHAEVSRLSARTRELDRTKTEFFANASHELRTPLTLILGPVRRLLATSALAGSQRHDLEVVERNARTLLRLVDDLLDLAQLEEQRLAPAYEQTDVPALVRLVSSHFDALAKEQGVQWKVQVPAALRAQFDPQMIQRVLFNLLSNAFKFTPRGAAVRLSVAAHGDRLVIEVADGGPGIPCELREAVFERFRQLQQRAAMRHPGSGLGLAIARDLVRLHGGEISIAEAPEGGALFVVALPLRAPAAVSVAPSTDQALAAIQHAALATDTLRPAQEAPAELPPGDAPLVLVVEDNPDMSAFICSSLARDWRVSAAFDGEQGLHRALTLQPDLVLTDLMMPGTNGDSLLRELRRRPMFDDTPVIVLSARSDDELRIRMLREGAQDYLVKPFAVEELRARVGTLLERAQAMAALRRSEEYWRELFAQSSDGILVGDLQCRVLDANPAACRLLGREHGQVLGTDPGDWLAAGGTDARDRMVAELRSGRALAREWAVMRPDGATTHLDVTASRLSDGRCIAVLRDATQRRRRQQAVEAMAEELEQRVATRTEQPRRLAADLERAESRERRQIALDLHDDLGQVIAAARIRLAVLLNDAREDVRRHAGEVSELLEHANRSTRSLAAQLAPAVLYELGLTAAMQWLADQLDAQFGLRVDVHDDGDPKPLSQEARSIVYRATRELLINVAKHAGVKSAEVSIARESRWVLVSVSDGGLGLPAGAKEAVLEHGMGLASVRERLSYIGGTLELRSKPGDGIEAILCAPLDTSASAPEAPRA